MKYAEVLRIFCIFNGMKESQLHFFWERSLLPQTRLKTTSGERVCIISRGQYNENESGPDFLNARILIGQIEWVGNVEIHVKSSDWKKHGHHNDAHYDNVILHVVFEHDANHDELISSLPTLLFSDYYDVGTIESIAIGQVINNRLLCKNQLQYVSAVNLAILKESVMYDRLIQKTKQFESMIDDPREMLYKLLALAFGKNVNKLPFEQLTNSLPFRELDSCNGMKRVNAISDFFRATKHNERSNKVKVIWKDKGLHAHGFPAVRALQFAGFLSDYDFAYQFVYLSTEEIYSYLMKMFDSRNAVLRRLSLNELSSQMEVGLIVNAFAPFLFWYGQHIESEDIVEKAFHLLKLAKPEDNKIIRMWKKSSLKITNAFDSQAYLAIYQQFCRHKKCVSCPIGQNILKT